MAVYGPENNEELYHIGVKRRSGRYPWGSGKEPYQSNPAMAKKAAKEHKKEKRASDMSDDELNKALNRMRLEKQYDELRKERISRGHKFLKSADASAKKLVAVTATAIALYNNYEKLLTIADKIGKKKG